MSKSQVAKRDKSQEKQRVVAEKIQVILLKYNMALQPFLDFSPMGVVPRVRLVDTSKPDNVEQTGNQDEVGDNQDSDGATESQSA